ncbi:Ubiquitin C-terminal hydrolase 22 [Trebouxia sp. C0009 RCD-2024]
MVASCKHVLAYRNRSGSRAAFSQLRIGLLSLWKRDANLQERLRQTEQTPIVCMHCACASTTCTHYQQQHYATAKTGHELAVDLQHDQLYCAACNTYVHDAAFTAAIQKLIHFPEHAGHETQPGKKVKQETLLAPCEAVLMHGTFAAGLRGLNNLGNTCFMNSILQVFLHVPLLRTFFLGGGHMHRLCPHLTPPDKPGKCLSCELDNIFSEAYSGHRVPFSPIRFLDTWWRSAGGSLAGYQQQDAHEFYLSLLDGLSQPMDRSTTPSASGSPSPGPRCKSLTPTSEGLPGALKGRAPMTDNVDLEALNSAPSLNAWGLGLAGGRPNQAATSAIDLVTSSSSGLETSSQSREEEDIESTMDQIFGGILRSDVVCSSCGYTSTAHDPFKDISVDIPEPPRPFPQPPAVDTPKPNPVKGSGKGSKGNGKGSNGKGGGRGGKTSVAGAKRGADALFPKDWENATEPSEPALSDGSAFPATTEASARCSSVDDQGSVAGHVDSGRDQTVSSPLHPSAPQGPPPTYDALAGGQWGEEQDPGSKTAGAGAGVGAGLQGPDGTQGSAQEWGSLEGFKGSGQSQGQGGGKGRGHNKGQRPSSAPTSPVAAPGKMVKPTRCQKCHTCRHKQLKKQCLRNKALSSPTKKNIEDALQGGVEAAELTPILPAHLQPPDARSMPERGTGSEAAPSEVMPPQLLPVLQSSRHRQAAQRQRNKPSLPPTQSQGLSKPPVASQGSGRVLDASQRETPAKQAGVPHREEEDLGLLPMAAAGGRPVPSPPPPLPVKAHPHSRPADASATQDTVIQQRQLQQQQHQHQYDVQLAAVEQTQTGAGDSAQQAVRRFEQSISQQETRGVETGGGGGSGVLLQACLHRFVRPETLHRWTCSRCQCQRRASKQLSIRQLPPVLCLHIKRFKATDKGATKKVETPLAFPVAHLDMAPFTSAAVLAARCHLKSALSGQQGAIAEAFKGSTAYSLHAVVCHTGNLLGGHYIGYVRSGALWYQFDDARVTLVPEQHVRMSNAYMLFYLQQ